MTDLAEVDFFLGRQLRLRQFSHGHRAGTDAVLVAAAAPEKIDGLALDVGAGVGAAGLALAALRPGLKFALVENDPAAAALSRANLRLNDFENRGAVYETDIFDAASRAATGLSNEMADVVITNPPFLDPARARLSPDAGKRAAHAMVASGSGALTDWLKACLSLLKRDGQLIIIHRPEVLPVILANLEDRAAIAVKPILPRADCAATRIIARIQKGGRAPFRIAPPLILHEGDRFTARAEAIHRGAALIVW